MKQVEDFSKRLDKIFNDGDPTKARIIDAYMKTNPIAQEQVKNNVDLHNVSKRFEIEFETHLRADIEIKDNVPTIKRVVNGWGEIVAPANCIIKQI